MAENKLEPHQREYVIELLAAEYSVGVINHFLRQTEKDAEGNAIGPQLARQTIYEYRKHHKRRIEKLRQQQREAAPREGVANQPERIRRLAKHADALEIIKWVPDPKTGKLHNEKAWRETLHQIAEEKGELRQPKDAPSQVDLVSYTPDQWRDELERRRHEAQAAMQENEQ